MAEPVDQEPGLQTKPLDELCRSPGRGAVDTLELFPQPLGVHPAGLPRISLRAPVTVFISSSGTFQIP